MKQSETYFRKALELAPHDPNIALDLASFLLDAGNAQEALPLALQAQRTEPWKPVVFFVGAVAHAGAGQCDEAETDRVRYTRLLVVNGKEPPAGTTELVADRVRSCRTARAHQGDATHLRDQDVAR